MLRVLFLLALATLSLDAADESLSPPLQLLRDSSDLVVVAEFATLPGGSSGSAPLSLVVTGSGVQQRAQIYFNEAFPCRILIKKILKGIPPARIDPLVSLRIPLLSDPYQTDDPDTALKGFSRHTRWIFFLKSRDPSSHVGANGEESNLIGFDPWLSVQPYSASLETLITPAK